MMHKTSKLPATLVHSLLAIFAFLCLFLTKARAQPDDNGGEPASSDVPLDVGIAWLAAGGTVYAYGFLRRGRAIRKKNSHGIREES